MLVAFCWIDEVLNMSNQEGKKIFAKMVETYTSAPKEDRQKMMHMVVNKWIAARGEKEHGSK